MGFDQLKLALANLFLARIQKMIKQIGPGNNLEAMTTRILHEKTQKGGKNHGRREIFIY